MTGIREKIVQKLIKHPPKGDLVFAETETSYRISCVFVFYQRIDLMKNILSCLVAQQFERNAFEVILVEDHGGSEAGQGLKGEFEQLNITHYAPGKGWGKMGFMRNYGLSRAKGEVILFLDDDTVILQETFLKVLDGLFRLYNELKAVIPRGTASWCLVKEKYQFHDAYFFTNRCMAYRRSCLINMGGFDSGFTGQEDVELAIRFISLKYSYMKTDRLRYYHPPLIYHNLNKGAAVGASFARSAYPFFIKIFLLINGARWLPLLFLSGTKNKNQGLFAAGFVKGFVQELAGIDRKGNYL